MSHPWRRAGEFHGRRSRKEKNGLVGRVYCLRDQKETIFLRKGHKPGGKTERKIFCKCGQKPMAREFTGLTRESTMMFW